MHYLIKTCSVSILILLSFEFFASNLSSLIVAAVPVKGPISDPLEETSVNEMSIDVTDVLLSNSDLFSFTLTDDSSSSKSENDVFFMTNSKSSSIFNIGDSSFVSRDTGGSAPSHECDAEKKHDLSPEKSEPGQYTRRKGTKKKKQSTHNFLFKKGRNSRDKLKNSQ